MDAAPDEELDEEAHETMKNKRTRAHHNNNGYDDDSVESRNGEAKDQEDAFATLVYRCSK